MVYKDIEKRRAAQRRHYRKQLEWFRKRDANRISKTRLKAMVKIDPKLICTNCGCNDLRILEINHKNGGGSKEMKYIYKKRLIVFYRDIVAGRRNTEDLDLRCKICNILHYVETVLNIEGFKVKYIGSK